MLRSLCKNNILTFVGLLAAYIAGSSLAYAGGVSVGGWVLGVCGNGTAEEGEQCDGEDFWGDSCVSLGYGGGELSCTPRCVLQTAACSLPSPVPQGGGGGGTEVAHTKVIFSGIGYPYSRVSILKNGQTAASFISGGDGRFKVEIGGLSGGEYTFSVIGEDAQGERSKLINFPIHVQTGTTMHISGVFLPPTIGVDRTAVKRGEIMHVFGYTAPKASVTIGVASANETYQALASDDKGAYAYQLETAFLEEGEHEARSRTSHEGIISQFSDPVSFTVGDAAKTEELSKKSDINDDRRVNLIDFSLLAYWYSRPVSFVVLKKMDISGNGKIGVEDFSIMAYHWTG